MFFECGIEIETEQQKKGNFSHNHSNNNNNNKNNNNINTKREKVRFYFFLLVLIVLYSLLLFHSVLNLYSDLKPLPKQNRNAKKKSERDVERLYQAQFLVIILDKSSLLIRIKFP